MQSCYNIYICRLCYSSSYLRGRVGIQLNNLIQPHFVPAQTRTWISIGIYHELFLCSMIEMRDKFVDIGRISDYKILLQYSGSYTNRLSLCHNID